MVFNVFRFTGYFYIIYVGYDPLFKAHYVWDLSGHYLALESGVGYCTPDSSLNTINPPLVLAMDSSGNGGKSAGAGNAGNLADAGKAPVTPLVTDEERDYLKRYTRSLGLPDGAIRDYRDQTGIPYPLLYIFSHIPMLGPIAYMKTVKL